MRSLAAFALLAVALLASGWVTPNISGYYQSSGGSAPSNTALPVVSSSSPVVGAAETTTNGTWANSPTGYTYQWNWADASSPISGATASSYTPVSGDIGHTLSATVTASNGFGSNAATSSATSAVAAGGSDTTFVALQTYYISPTGSDVANGLTPATAWATPNHAVNCGDVIVAASGAYNSAWQSFGAVSNCPSTTGGIDGAGGVYFAVLLCGGSGLGASDGCTKSTGASTSIRNAKSNWAVEGFTVTAAGGGGRGFECNATASGTTLVDYQAYINDIAYANNQGYDINDQALNHNNPGNGCDHWAVVGSIAQDAASDPICLAAIDSVAPTHDSGSTTDIRVFIGGNFAIKNLQRSGCGSDGEGIMFDTWDAHAMVGIGIARDNIVTESERYGIQLFYQNFNSSSATIKIYNNTGFANDAGTHTINDFADGDINIASTTSTIPYTINIFNNVFKSHFQTIGGVAGNGMVYAMVMGGNYGALTGAVAGNPASSQNIFKGQRSTCPASCDTGDNVAAFNSGSFGTNTYVDPAFNGETDYLTNRDGAPACSGFETTVQCYGYDAYSQTLTPNTLIYDLTATAVGTSGKGYRLPSTACASSDADFPTWLKGVVYLHWTGSAIVQRHGLVTTPCGL